MDDFIGGLAVQAWSAPRYTRDVRMTLVRMCVHALDWSYIRSRLSPLAAAKDAPEIMDQLESLRKKAAQR